MKTQTVNIDNTSQMGPSPETTQALFQSNVQRDISDIKKLVTSIQETLEKSYVSKAEFAPVKDGLKSMQIFFYTIGTSAVVLIVTGVLKLILKV